jgi:hypothetical protein
LTLSLYAFGAKVSEKQVRRMWFFIIGFPILFGLFPLAVMAYGFNDYLLGTAKVKDGTMLLTIVCIESFYRFIVLFKPVIYKLY